MPHHHDDTRGSSGIDCTSLHGGFTFVYSLKAGSQLSKLRYCGLSILVLMGEHLSTNHRPSLFAYQPCDMEPAGMEINRY